MSTRIVVVGDAMLDRDVEGSVERICPEAPVPVLDEASRSATPGGAARAAVLAARAGAEVALVTAVGDDEAGDHLRGLLRQAGVTLLDLGMDASTPEKIRLRCEGRTLLRLDRGGEHRPHIDDPADCHRDALAAADAILVSDYGRGITSQPLLRRMVATSAAHVPVVWDPHPRGREPVQGVSLATPNRREAAAIANDVRGAGLRGDAARARRLRTRWRANAVSITLGAEGALLEIGHPVPMVVPAPSNAAGDPCGAGDCFAASAARAFADGATYAESVRTAVAAATRYVAGDHEPAADVASPATPSERLARALGVCDRVRGEGGTVVATGGCFDLLHAGHVSTLEAARRLGDCLVVLLNSDRSVSRLKGPNRPVVGEEDRTRLLESLECVDAVVVFDDETPAPMLARLKPHIFAKGGDYAAEELPETAVMRRHSGQTVILPTLAGRSTTALVARAAGGAS